MPRLLIVLFSTLFFFLFVQKVKAQEKRRNLSPKEQIISNHIEASVNFRDSSLNLSIETCEKAIELAQKQEVDSLLAFALKTQGINYYYFGDFDTSLDYYNKAKPIFQTLGNKIQEGKLLSNIGVAYYCKGEYNKALSHYFEGLEVFSEVNYLEGLSSTYLNIGNLSFLMCNYDRAETYFSSALKLSQETENLANEINALNNLGAVYEKQNRFEEALEAYEKSLDFVMDRGNTMMESRLYLNIAVLYRRTGAYDLAETYLKKCFDIRKLKDNYDDLLKVYQEMYELAFAKKAYSKAERLVGIMLDMAEINEDVAWLNDIYLIYRDFYRAIGRYQLSLESYEKHIQINDSLNNAINLEKYEELMLKYDMSQTKQNMESLQQKARIQKLELDKKNAWLVALLVVMLLGVLTIIVSFRINKLKAEHKLMSLDQKVLLSQMNPHFLFNALTAVQSLVLDDEKDKANSYLVELARLVRSILEDSRKEDVRLSEEISTLKRYIALQKLRFDYPLDFRFDIDEGIDMDRLHVPPMLMQPFIENALLHANLQEVENPEIRISLKLVDAHFVEFSIQDNGIGIEEGKKQASVKGKASLAMQIAYDRIQIYNFRSKHRMKFDIVDLKYSDNTAQGTRARFTIPAQS